MTAKEIAETANCPVWKVYYIKNRIGRLPTVDEVKNYKARRGAPIKYELKEGNNENNYTE